MKAEVKDLPPVPQVFMPKQITITLYNETEAKLFRHLIDCWGDPIHCNCRKEVKEMANELHELVRTLPI